MIIQAIEADAIRHRDGPRGLQALVGALPYGVIVLAYGFVAAALIFL